MKKYLIILLSALLSITMLFSGCAENAVGEVTGTDEIPAVTTDDAIDSGDNETDTGTDTGTDTDTNIDTDKGTEDKEPDKDGPYVVKESYMPEAVSAQMKKIFEEQSASFLTYTYDSCPYVMRDMFTISNCKLLSISIPVSKTLETDAKGNFLFTISVGNNQWNAIKNSVVKTYKISVNAKEHGLTANTTGVNKWVKVDISKYNIVLSATQTVGLGKTNDTLIPAYIGNGDKGNAAQALIEESFPQMRGYVSKMGLGTDIGTSKDTLIYDFEWERTYASEADYKASVAAEAEYQKILAAVKEKYAGKKLSILGDSISTYAGYSNNTSYNATIGKNAVYYQTSGSVANRGLYDHSDTYWYRLITDLNMELCVNNSWSGSRVYDTARMPGRAGELGNKKGETPDVIIFYMGINDLHNDSAGQFGDLYKILSNSNDNRSDKEKIEEWLSTFTESKYTTFDQSYALCLKTMIEKYPNVEIWCQTLIYNRDSRFNTTSMNQYNRCITALAEYYGVNIIDQSNGYITLQNCVKYSCDGKGLHPNSMGHALMEKHIIETFYQKMTEK